MEDLRGDDSGDKELRAVGVGAGVGHGQEALPGVLELEVLVGELVTVDCRGEKAVISRQNFADCRVE